MKRLGTGKVIVSATLAVGLLGSGMGTSVASAQPNSPSRYEDRTGQANRTTDLGGGFDWAGLVYSGCLSCPACGEPAQPSRAKPTNVARPTNHGRHTNRNK
jgi:hypothetical protein